MLHLIHKIQNNLQFNNLTVVTTRIGVFLIRWLWLFFFLPYRTADQEVKKLGTATDSCLWLRVKSTSESQQLAVLGV